MTRKYKIDISKNSLSVFIFLFIMIISLIISIIIYIPNVFTLFKIVIATDILSIVIFILFFSIVRSYVVVDSNSVFINAGVYCRKRIKLNDIVRVYHADIDCKYISRAHPVYSKNVIGIDYENNKIIYVSIKNGDNFIDFIESKLSPDIK